MKVTLFISVLSEGGAERVVSNLANYLEQKGHKVTILLVENRVTYKVNQEVRVFPLHSGKKRNIPHIFVNLIRAIRFYKYIFTNKSDVYISFIPKLHEFILKNRKLISAPIILAERADPETFYNQSATNKKIFEKYYRLADGYIFQTRYAREFYRNKGINVLNSIIIPNAVNPEFTGKQCNGKRKKEIVGVGRFCKQKNFPMLLKAFAIIHKEFPEYMLKIYGTGPLLDGYIELIKRLAISEYVNFPGYIESLDNEIIDSAMFVLSSNYEGISNALIEAMAMGIPCIATDCPAGGSAYLIQNGINGILIPVGDVNALAEAMRKIIREEEYARKIGEEARKISIKLNADKIYSQWETYIDSMVMNRKKQYGK